MWFRNLLMYRLTSDTPITADALETALAAKPALPCGSQTLSTYGFVAPFGKDADAPLVHVGQGFFLICARTEERMLPGTVVRDAVKEKPMRSKLSKAAKFTKKNAIKLKMKSSKLFYPEHLFAAPKLSLLLHLRKV